MICDVCLSAMKTDILPGTYLCRSCGYGKSEFPIHINRSNRIDEAARSKALSALRIENFESILDHCSSLIPQNARILDVGCAHGWFLDVASRRGMTVIGIEPDREMAEIARSKGHRVLEGFFPSVLDDEDRFDAITFNDVFEHLPNIATMADVIKNYLSPGGIVVVNIPISDGIIYRVARFAAILRQTKALERMWQVGLPSPHISYFSKSSLLKLFQRKGYGLQTDCALKSMELKSLWSRIRYDSHTPIGLAMLTFAAAVPLRVLTSNKNSDIRLLIFKVV